MQDRLRDLGAQDCDVIGDGAERSNHAQTELLLDIAHESGFLIESDYSWEEFSLTVPKDRRGSEHVVEFVHELGLVGKTTIPSGYGLTPFLNVIEESSADPSASNTYRKAIEFRPATVLEYLGRWNACNEVFGDNVRLASVIRWKDGLVSLCITQPQYPGACAEDREIARYFIENGWSCLQDPSGHNIFYHYGYEYMAIDAVGRNCFLDEQGIQPFDVILCKPGEELERFLKIY